MCIDIHCSTVALQCIYGRKLDDPDRRAHLLGDGPHDDRQYLSISINTAHQSMSVILSIKHNRTRTDKKQKRNCCTGPSMQWCRACAACARGTSPLAPPLDVANAADAACQIITSGTALADCLTDLPLEVNLHEDINSETARLLLMKAVS